LIDQTKLPNKLEFIECSTSEDVADCIKGMNIRGAPAIGVAAAFGLALTAYHSKVTSRNSLARELEESASRLRSTRPTAANLFWAIERIMKLVRAKNLSAGEMKNEVLREALRIAEEDKRVNEMIGKNGAKLLEDGFVVLTHCNTGFLATSGDCGTALGVIKTAAEEGKNVEVIVTETRPLLQGARLTSWELKHLGIPFTLITDTAVGFVFEKGMVDCAIVGADRIVSDAVINKIGTYQIAVLAREHRVPFYVAAPVSSIDPKRRARDVVIEERDREEITRFAGHRITPKGTRVINPAFDITPMRYVARIITELGVFPPKRFVSKISKKSSDRSS
jgi:methylthioribose-1-phosphate isomerase